MSRQQAYVEELRRSWHDNLVAELCLRQRNIVFPDTVRNLGIFYRNMAGESIHAYTSHRIFAVFFGLFLLTEYVVFSVIFGSEWSVIFLTLIGLSPWIAVGLKITLNAIIREDRPKLQLSKTYPHVKI